jgi:hypothetical protein
MKQQNKNKNEFIVKQITHHVLSGTKTQHLKILLKMHFTILKKPEI